MSENEEQPLLGGKSRKSKELQSLKAKEKGPSRLFHLVLTIYYFALLLVAVIVLGVFAMKHRSFVSYIKNVNASNFSSSCILDASYKGEQDYTTILNYPIIHLGGSGWCHFVIWAQVFVTIGCAVLFFLTLVRFFIGPKVLAVASFLDLLLIFLCSLGSFAVGVTISIGLSKTCSQYVKNGIDVNSCSQAVFQYKSEKFGTINFYGAINSAKTASWVNWFMLFIVLVLYAIIVLIYLVKNSRKDKASRKRMQEAAATSQVNEQVEDEETEDTKKPAFQEREEDEEDKPFQ